MYEVHGCLRLVMTYTEQLSIDLVFGGPFFFPLSQENLQHVCFKIRALDSFIGMATHKKNRDVAKKFLFEPYMEVISSIRVRVGCLDLKNVANVSKYGQKSLNLKMHAVCVQLSIENRDFQP